MERLYLASIVWLLIAATQPVHSEDKCFIPVTCSKEGGTPHSIVEWRQYTEKCQDCSTTCPPVSSTTGLPLFTSPIPTTGVVNLVPRTELDVIAKALCPILYAGRCYVPILGTPGAGAESQTQCANINGILADIQNQEHMDIVMNYVRDVKILGGRRFRHLRLGMYFIQARKQMIFRNGTDVPAALGLKTSSSYPSSGLQHTEMALLVDSDSNSANQYLINVGNTDACNVLCEIGADDKPTMRPA